MSKPVCIDSKTQLTPVIKKQEHHTYSSFFGFDELGLKNGNCSILHGAIGDRSIDVWGDIVDQKIKTIRCWVSFEGSNEVFKSV